MNHKVVWDKLISALRGLIDLFNGQGRGDTTLHYHRVWYDLYMCVMVHVEYYSTHIAHQVIHR